MHSHTFSAPVNSFYQLTLLSLEEQAGFVSRVSLHALAASQASALFLYKNEISEPFTYSFALFPTNTSISFSTLHTSSSQRLTSSSHDLPPLVLPLPMLLPNQPQEKLILFFFRAMSSTRVTWFYHPQCCEKQQKNGKKQVNILCFSLKLAADYSRQLHAMSDVPHVGGSFQP